MRIQPYTPAAKPFRVAGRFPRIAAKKGPVVEFRAKLAASSGGEGAWTFLPIPAKVSEAWGVRGRIRLAGTVNGFPIETSAMPDGDGGHAINFNKAMQAGASAKAGDVVACVLGPAAPEGEPEIPPDLARALGASKEASTRWKAFTPTQRREYVAWLAEAKRSETRASRVEKTVARVARGVKRHD